jgi:low affinity Fe/Cu permease
LRAFRIAGARRHPRREKRTMKPSGWFTRFANHAARATGHPWAFLLAVIVVLVWVITGPIFKFSDTWQLVINTGTTIVTFLMVFLIQNTQNRDSAAIHIKLDELIRSHKPAHNSLLDLEQLDEEILGKMRERYCKLAAEARRDLTDALLDGIEDVDEATGRSQVRASDRSR